jgi:hypothetical protein
VVQCSDSSGPGADRQTSGISGAEFFALLGGGVKEPGWINTRLEVAAGGRAWLQPLQLRNVA